MEDFGVDEREEVVRSPKGGSPGAFWNRVVSPPRREEETRDDEKGARITFQ